MKCISLFLRLDVPFPAACSNTLNMEAAGTSETLVRVETNTLCHILVDWSFCSRRENPDLACQLFFKFDLAFCPVWLPDLPKFMGGLKARHADGVQTSVLRVHVIVRIKSGRLGWAGHVARTGRVKVHVGF